MTAVLPIARVGGIEIRVHVTWVLLLALLTLGLAVQLPASYPEWPPALAWVSSGVVAALAFGSVTAHELAHALIARHWRLSVTSIAVHVFGGTAVFDEGALRPGQDAAIAAAGPLTSFLVAAGSLLVWLATADATEPVVAAVATSAFLLGVFNLLVAVANLVPAFPFDGGRLVRAALWRVTGSKRRGTQLAGRVGRVLGIVAVLSGVLVALAGPAADGLLLVLAGWMLTSSARLIDQRLIIEQLTEGLHVEDAMERDSPGIPVGLTLDTFADQAVTETRGGGLPVVRDGQPVGLIGHSQLRRVARRRWPRLRAGDVMVALAALPWLAPELDLWTGLAQLQRSELDALPVLRNGVWLGLLTRRGVTQAVRAQAALRRDMGAGASGQVQL